MRSIKNLWQRLPAAITLWERLAAETKRWERLPAEIKLWERLAAAIKSMGRPALPAAVLICALLAAGPVLAAGAPMLGEILNKTEAKYQQSRAFTATFHQVTTSSAAGTITPGEAVGRLYYSRPGQMRWEYDQPEVQVFIANTAYAWLYVPSENQVSLFDAKKLFASPLARTFFDGAVGLKNHFEVSLDAAQSNKSAAVLKLVPKQEDPNIKILFLWIDLQTYRITRIDSQDILGNTNKIVLESLTPVSNLDPKLFHLEIPQATHVFDTEGRELTPVQVEQLKSRVATAKTP
ncbi:MAG: outer membrane lipoprotein carrier protein LolA [Syntrophobacteraceae bacterium]